MASVAMTSDHSALLEPVKVITFRMLSHNAIIAVLDAARKTSTAVALAVIADDAEAMPLKQAWREHVDPVAPAVPLFLLHANPDRAQERTAEYLVELRHVYPRREIEIIVVASGISKNEGVVPKWVKQLDKAIDAHGITDYILRLV
jgi:hypothetical protein